MHPSHLYNKQSRTCISSIYRDVNSSQSGAKLHSVSMTCDWISITTETSSVLAFGQFLLDGVFGTCYLAKSIVAGKRLPTLAIGRNCKPAGVRASVMHSPVSLSILLSVFDSFTVLEVGVTSRLLIVRAREVGSVLLKLASCLLSYCSISGRHCEEFLGVGVQRRWDERNKANLPSAMSIYLA